MFQWFNDFFCETKIILWFNEVTLSSSREMISSNGLILCHLGKIHFLFSESFLFLWCKVWNLLIKFIYICLWMTMMILLHSSNDISVRDTNKFIPVLFSTLLLTTVSIKTVISLDSQNRSIYRSSLPNIAKVRFNGTYLRWNMLNFFCSALTLCNDEVMPVLSSEKRWYVIYLQKLS